MPHPAIAKSGRSGHIGHNGSGFPRVRPDGKVNINPLHAGDPYYRWTMPPVELKVESTGNGVKTMLPNLAAIAKALRRPVDYVAQCVHTCPHTGSLNRRCTLVTLSRCSHTMAMGLASLNVDVV
jgi:hypothetical protein